MLDLTRRSEKSDIAKRRERAEKYLQKGKTSAALEEYLAILQDDPDNDGIRQTTADLYFSISCVKEGAALLGELFHRQAEAGDVATAVVTFKKLARFGTPTCDQSFRYAQLIEPSNKNEALEAYEAALTGYGALRNNKKSLAVLDRIVTLDPSGQNFWRAAELASELGDGQKAGFYFFRVGELEEQSGGKCGPWYERAFKADPLNKQIALAYGRSLLFEERAAESLEVLKPLMLDPKSASPEVKDLYGHALWFTGKLLEAEPILWELFEQNSYRLTEIAELIAAFLNAQQDAEAVALARKLEQHQRRKGNRREFISLMKDLVEKHRPSSSELLEYLVELFNAANRESDYCQTLIKLFDLYYAAGNFHKAADCLDRAAEVDAYEPGHQKRLEMLRGKLDDQRVNAIAQRFTHAHKAAEPQPKQEEADESSMLQDLMLQAEILVQYGMRSKALERLERIQQLFPHEEDRNEELRRLYMNVGLVPKYNDAPAAMAAAAAGAAPGPVAVPPPIAMPMPAPQVTALEPGGEGSNDYDVKNLSRVTEITRNLYQQANVKAVLTVAVNDIGTQWNAVRCIAGLRNPGKPPTLVLEYSGPGVTPSELPDRVKLLGVLQDAAVTRGPIMIADANTAPELAELQDVVKAVGGGSMMVLPLVDGQEHVGVLLLQAQSASSWKSSDILVLRSLSEQIVLALHNARLRRLVRNLSVTDEKSGLLKRSSYMDVLQSEIRRAIQQNSPTTVMLMEFGKGSTMLREFGQQAAEGMMRQVGQIISTHIRQADVAVQYESTTIAVILADTPEKGALLALEKLRRLVQDVHLPGRDTPPPITAGIAEAVIRTQFDPADIVTEVINRVEAALDSARSSTDKDQKICALPCAFAVEAVA